MATHGQINTLNCTQFTNIITGHRIAQVNRKLLSLDRIRPNVINILYLEPDCIAAFERRLPMPNNVYFCLIFVRLGPCVDLLYTRALRMIACITRLKCLSQ